MSIEHDNLPVDPRLDALLRGMLTSDDLQPAQNARVRARLGLLASPSDQPTLTVPSAQAQFSTSAPEANPLAPPPRARLRRQWLQFALAAVAFVAVGGMLALLFGSGGGDSDTRPGATIDPAQAVRDVLAPLPPELERRTVLEVETHTAHDNAFNQWTIERWQRWSATGVFDEGLFVTDPTGESVTHIILDGQASLMNWAPRDWALDVPLEYSLQRRVFAATLAAVDDPATHNLQHETRDGQTVLTFEWNDNQSEEFDYIHRAEAWIDPETGQLQRIVHFVDRPDQDPYPTRTYTFRESENLPAGSSPEGTYTIEGSTLPQDIFATETAMASTPSAAPTPDEMSMYRDLTFEQAQAIVPFEIIAPSQVPQGLDAPVITVIDVPQVSGEPFYRVEMSYGLTGDETPAQSVQFLQQVAQPETSETPDGATTVEISGIPVTRSLDSSAPGDPLLTYRWQDNNVGYLIIARTNSDLTPGLVEQLMLSILVPPGPTAEDQSVRLERERAEMMQVPVPVSCAVDAWAGPDFRVRRSDSAAYFIDGDGLTLGTTHGVLVTGDNTITWLASAPLTTEEALTGPRSIVAFRSDVAGDPVPVEIPIVDAQQIERGIIPSDAERAWTSTATFPSEGCWEIEVELGVHTLSATVFVYPQPPAAVSAIATQDQAANYAIDILAGKHWDNPDVAADLHAIDPIVTAVEHLEADGQAWWEVQVSGRFEISACPVRRLPTSGTRICNVGDQGVIRFQADSGKDASIEIAISNGTVTFAVNSSNWIEPTPTP